MSNYSNAVSEIYKETGGFVLLGLTGRTGSGCSTAASILSGDEVRIPEKSSIYSSVNDARKYKIARNYVKENWNQFVCIQVRTVLSSFLLELDFEERSF